MPYRMHSEYLRHLFLDNDLAEGRFLAAGKPISLTDIRTPIFAVGTERDHVTPWRSTYKIKAPRKDGSWWPEWISWLQSRSGTPPRRRRWARRNPVTRNLPRRRAPTSSKTDRRMDRELAKELKAAGFPIAVFRAGHEFYPPEQGGGWSDDARQHGVTVTHYDLEDRMQGLKDGYYCPNVADLIEACGSSRLISGQRRARSRHPPMRRSQNCG
jgi:hypothetical protein